MIYHASSIAGISELIPSVSNHGISLVYFSKKRENDLVYLSNAIERFCKETGYDYSGKWKKWGTYGFDKNGILSLEEYYPNAIEKTYKGVSGYIYSSDCNIKSEFEINIPDAVVCTNPVKVKNVEYISDAYEAILEAEREGLIKILRYSDLSESSRR